MFQKPQSPSFTFFGTMRHTGNFKKGFKKIGKFFPHKGTIENTILDTLKSLLFLSLRYGADLGRSWLVFDTPDLFKMVLPKVPKFRKVSQSLGLVDSTDF